jgi:hypothetical protein
MRIAPAVSLLIGLAGPALAQQAVQVWTPLGYQQITSGTIGSATSLTLPTNAAGGGQVRWAYICAETATIRWRDDGTSPTASVGQPLFASTCFQYSGALNKIKFIASATPATLDVSYYR